MKGNTVRLRERFFKSVIYEQQPGRSAAPPALVLTLGSGGWEQFTDNSELKFSMTTEP